MSASASAKVHTQKELNFLHDLVAEWSNPVHPISLGDAQDLHLVPAEGPKQFYRVRAFGVRYAGPKPIGALSTGECAAHGIPRDDLLALYHLQGGTYPCADSTPLADRIAERFHAMITGAATVDTPDDAEVTRRAAAQATLDARRAAEVERRQATEAAQRAALRKMYVRVWAATVYDDDGTECHEKRWAVIGNYEDAEEKGWVDEETGVLSGELQTADQLNVNNETLYEIHRLEEAIECMEEECDRYGGDPDPRLRTERRKLAALRATVDSVLLHA